VRTLADCLWLEVTIPLPSDLADFPRPERSELAQPPDAGFVQLNVENQPGTEGSWD